MNLATPLSNIKYKKDAFMGRIFLDKVVGVSANNERLQGKGNR